MLAGGWLVTQSRRVVQALQESGTWAVTRASGDISIAVCEGGANFEVPDGWSLHLPSALQCCVWT